MGAILVIAPTYVCTRTIRGYNFVITPHNYGCVTTHTLSVSLAYSQAKLSVMMLITLFNRALPAGEPGYPVILLAFPSFILGLLTQPHHSCGTGALEGPLCQKCIFAVQFWGEPEASPPSPQTPLLHQLLVN